VLNPVGHSQRRLSAAIAADPVTDMPGKLAIICRVQCRTIIDAGDQRGRLAECNASRQGMS
ncbi:MAG TPA: hypothetical protein PLX03_05050, partial [Candidatus Hydrogenedentes bacterium]|nr:hypothetical protein [Candidatus Hydrogenedentota bacterium]